MWLGGRPTDNGALRYVCATQWSMANWKVARLEKLFRAQELREHPGWVACPICFMAIAQSDLGLGALRAASAEHAPQEFHRSGGVERCITCKPCNNERRYEAKAGSLNDLATGRDVVEEFEPFVEIKNAYLLAFAALGYRFILDPALDIIRRTILQTDLTDPIAACHQLHVGSENLNLLPNRIYAVGISVRRGERGYPALAVTLPANHPVKESCVLHYVLLPRPGTGPSFYRFLQSFGSEKDLWGGRLMLALNDGEAGYPLPDAGDLPMRWDDSIPLNLRIAPRPHTRINEDHGRLEYLPEYLEAASWRSSGVAPRRPQA